MQNKNQILDFALRYEDKGTLPKTAVISIKELSKDSSCVEALIQRGLVQALGHLTKTRFVFLSPPPPPPLPVCGSERDREGGILRDFASVCVHASVCTRVRGHARTYACQHVSE